MKELSTEEKAKRYDEAIKKAKTLYQASEYMSGCDVIIKTIFPELKEREDERIRKALIDGFTVMKESKNCGKTFSNHNIPVTDILAWLEKQGEQKPADKVEPKFQNGQWIVWQNKCYKVNYNGCCYELIDQNGLSTSLEYVTVDENAHLWTIQDAKDGDVLAWDDSKCIALFKNIYDKDSFNSYGFVGHCTGAFESRQSYHDIKGAHPATKEQRDFLFQKMKEAGYEWDADKKELKKGEQKSIKTCAEYYNNGRELKMPALSEFQDKLADILMFREYDGPDETEDDIAKGRLEYELAAIRLSEELLPLAVKQNPAAWSEEDESIRSCIGLALTDVDEQRFKDFGTTLKDCLAWLKSLRPHSAWKPSEEMIEALGRTIPENVMEISEDEMLLGKLYQGLKYGRVLSEN